MFIYLTISVFLLSSYDTDQKQMEDIYDDHSISVTITPSTEARNFSQVTILLTRLHAGFFMITLSFAIQALLWKLLSQPTNYPHQLLSSLHISLTFPSSAFLSIWCLSLLTLILLCFLYLLRCFLHFYLVKEVFLHHVGVNFFYAPWISWLLLLQSAPITVEKPVTLQAIWLVFVIPIMVLDVKIYGQWFTTERKLLSLLANPASHLSLIGNLVGAQTAAKMGLQEIAVCLFSLGMAHYLVLFVTLYQRLLGAERFPAVLRPAFFFFFAAPSVASLAWKSISGAFDTVSKMLFYLSLFLFTSLVRKQNLELIVSFLLSCFS